MPTPIDPVSCPPAAPLITATGCDKAVLVKICPVDPLPPPPPLPTTASGVNCAGAVVTATGVGVAQTVPHPTAVQPTKDCDTPQVLASLAAIAAGQTAIVTELQKPEFAPLLSQCRTPDGTRWVVYTLVNEQTQAVTSQYFNIATGVPQPVPPLDLDCSSDEKVDTVPLKGCLAGVELIGYALLDTITKLIVGEFWRDPSTGLWGALPAGATAGACVATKPCTVQCTTSAVVATTYIVDMKDF